MAVRPPLVLGPDNLIQQLQPGDTIAAQTSTTNIRALTNAEASAAAPFGTPVYTSGSDAVKRGQANAKSTAKITGLVSDNAGIAAQAVGNIATDGVLVAATTAAWDAVTGGSGGLTPGSTYFLDPANVGKITAAPAFTNGSGQCNVVIGTALSTLELDLQIGLPIQL